MPVPVKRNPSGPGTIPIPFPTESLAGNDDGGLGVQITLEGEPLRVRSVITRATSQTRRFDAVSANVRGAETSLRGELE